jgi:hypothetical protein
MLFVLSQPEKWGLKTISCQFFVLSLRCQISHRLLEESDTVRAAELINERFLQTCMPKTVELVCTAEDCELDMFELHYTYDMPDSVGVSDFTCPYCGDCDPLTEVAL